MFHPWSWWFSNIYDPKLNEHTHDGSMVLGEKCQHKGGMLMGSMLPYIAAPWIRHGIDDAGSMQNLFWCVTKLHHHSDHSAEKGVEQCSNPLLADDYRGVQYPDLYRPH